MKKLLFSTRYANWSFNLATLVLRVGFGVLMAYHGFGKLTKYAEMKGSFMNFMGLGSSTSLTLTIFAEFVCSILLIAGLFTRFAAFVLLFTACIIVFKAHEMDIFGKAEAGTHYLLAYTAILLLGAGKFSLDAAIGGK